MTVVFESQRNAFFQAASGSGTAADPFVAGSGGPVYENKRNTHFQAASGSGTKDDPFVLNSGDLSWL